MQHASQFSSVRISNVEEEGKADKQRSRVAEVGFPLPQSFKLPLCLRYISMEKYQATFEDNGYDDLCYMGGGLVTKEDLFEIGINDPQDCTVLIDSLKLREHKFLFDKEGKPNLKDLASGTMEEWLKSIGLSQYVDNFRFSFLRKEVFFPNVD